MFEIDDASTFRISCAFFFKTARCLVVDLTTLKLKDRDPTIGTVLRFRAAGPRRLQATFAHASFAPGLSFRRRHSASLGRTYAVFLQYLSDRRSQRSPMWWAKVPCYMRSCVAPAIDRRGHVHISFDVCRAMQVVTSDSRSAWDS